MFRNGAGLGISGNRFQAKAAISSRITALCAASAGVIPPAKRAVAGNKNAWRVELLLILEPAHDCVAGIHFLARSNFLWRKRRR
jgi:hypothetical protein